MDRAQLKWRETSGSPAPPTRATGLAVLLLASCGLWAEDTLPNGVIARLGEPKTGLRDIGTGVKFSPDGGRLAVTEWNGWAQVYELESRNCTARFRAPRNYLITVAFAPDGEHIVTGGFDGVAAWSLPDGVISTKIDSGVFAGSGIAFSPDGSRIAYGCSDKAVRVWTWPECRLIAEFDQQRRVAYGVCFSPDGRSLVGAGGDGQMYVWDVDESRLIRRIPAPELMTHVAFSPLGDLVASGCFCAAVWDVNSGTCVATMKQGAERSGSSSVDVAFTQCGELLVWTNGHSVIRVSEVATGRLILELDAGIQVMKMSMSPDGKMLASSSADSTAYLWGLEGLLGVEESACEAASDSELAQWWADLADDDAECAYKAMLSLRAAGTRATSMLEGQMDSLSPSTDPVKDSLVQLDSEDPELRQGAEEELERWGPVLEPQLEMALTSVESLEVRTRLEGLRERIQIPSRFAHGEWMRRLRGIVVLGWIRSNAARETLERIAAGPKGARETTWAAQALAKFPKR